MSFVFASPGAIAFHLGPLTVRWYGILMATAILVGFWKASPRTRSCAPRSGRWWPG